jgi:hypothetical protein
VAIAPMIGLLSPLWNYSPECTLQYLLSL